MKDNLRSVYKFGFIASLSLIILGSIYLILAGTVIFGKFDPVTSIFFQMSSNILTLLSALTYLLLIVSITTIVKNKIFDTLALLFGTLFVGSIFFSKITSIVTIIQSDVYNKFELLNLYAWPSPSITFIIESIGWYQFYSFSIFFISFSVSQINTKNSKIISILCKLSGLCSFLGIFNIIFNKPIFAMMGIIGAGILATVISVLMAILFRTLLKK